MCNVAELFFEAERLETHLGIDFICRGGWLVVLCLGFDDAARQSDRSSESHSGFASGQRLVAIPLPPAARDQSSRQIFILMALHSLLWRLDQDICMALKNTLA